MEYQQTDFQKPTDYRNSYSNGMATASLVLGILSIVTACCVYTTFIFASLGILLGILSRGSETSLSTTSIMGIVFSSIGFVALIGIIIFAFAAMIAEAGGFYNFFRYYLSDMEYYMEYYNNILTIPFLL